MNTFIDILLAFINSGLMIYTFMLFYKSFSFPKYSFLFSSIYISALTIIFTFVLWLIPVSVYRTLLIVSMPFLVSLIYRFKWHMHILLSIIAYALAGTSELVTTALLSAFFAVSPQAATQDFFQIVSIVLSKLIIILLIAIIRIRKYKISYSLQLRSILPLIFLPASSIFVSLIHIYWFLQLSEVNPFLSLTNSISYIVLILSNILVFQFINVAYESIQKDKLIAASQELIQAQTQQYQQLLEHNQQIYKIDHDHKNFLIGMISELESGNVNTVLTVLKEEQASLSQNRINPNSNVITAIVNAKADLAQKNGITLEATYGELQNVNISHIDIAIILGNALDNAIEALQRTNLEPKTVKLFAKVNNEMIIISIKNQVLKNLDVTSLTSEKVDGDAHGIGIFSMRQLAEKYSGEVLLTCENLIFETHIILRNSSVL